MTGLLRSWFQTKKHGKDCGTQTLVVLELQRGISKPVPQLSIEQSRIRNSRSLLRKVRCLDEAESLSRELIDFSTGRPPAVRALIAAYRLKTTRPVTNFGHQEE